MNTLLLIALSLSIQASAEQVPDPKGGTVPVKRAGRKQEVSPLKAEPLHPVIEKLATLVGGTWVSVPADPQKPFVIEYRYEMAFGGRAVRARGVFGKGTPEAMETEALIGWDPEAKSVYYIDFHGDQTVYRGTITATDTGIAAEFATIVGKPGQYRSRNDFPDKDTLVVHIFGQRDGQWTELHTVHLKRRR